MRIPEMEPVTVIGLDPQSEPRPYVPGGHSGLYTRDGHGPRTHADSIRYLQSVIRQKEQYFLSNHSTQSKHYRDPAGSATQSQAVLSAVIPEIGKLVGHVANVFKNELDSNSFKMLKAISVRHASVIQGMVSANAIKHDVQSGVSSAVAVGSELGLLIANVFSSKFLGAILVRGLTLTPGPTALAAIAGSVIISLFMDFIEVKKTIADLLNKALANSGQVTELAVGPTTTGQEPSAENVIFTDYQFYRAMREIISNPKAYPEAQRILGNLVEKLLVVQRPGQEQRGPTSTVLALPDQDVVLIQSERGESRLFIARDGNYLMHGKEGLNWFMPISEHNTSSGAIGHADAYNVLDFSLNAHGVDIVIEGNDRLDARIAELAAQNGISAGNLANHYLTRGNTFRLLRDSHEFFQDLSVTGSDALFLSEEYRNIDYVIGSRFDDIIIGDVLGGMTFAGGRGNDVFVIHGGANRIVISDADLDEPGSAEMTTKHIHGFVTAQEAQAFNARFYSPTKSGQKGVGGFRLESDVLDFSNLDGDVLTPGHQPLMFIGGAKFSGKAGEFRHSTREFHGLDFPDLQQGSRPVTTLFYEGDRDGDGTADFQVAYHAYANPSAAEPWTNNSGYRGPVFSQLGSQDMIFF